jgi:hypothetical protein
VTLGSNPPFLLLTSRRPWQQKAHFEALKKLMFLQQIPVWLFQMQKITKSKWWIKSKRNNNTKLPKIPVKALTPP